MRRQNGGDIGAFPAVRDHDVKLAAQHALRHLADLVQRVDHDCMLPVWVSATILLTSVPQPSISILTSSPTFRNSPRGMPTPAGEPVAITSPGCNVKCRLR